MSCPECGSTMVRPSRARSRLNAPLRLLGFGRVRCRTCGFRFYRFGATERQAERRAFERFAVALPATFESDQSSGTGTTTNVSHGGCGILSASSPPVGAALHVSISVSQRSVQLSGVVVHCIEGKGFGIKFTEMTEPQRGHLSVLLRYCRHMVEKEEPPAYDRIVRIRTGDPFWTALGWAAMVLVIAASAAALTVGLIRCSRMLSGS